MEGFENGKTINNVFSIKDDEHKQISDVKPEKENELTEVNGFEVVNTNVKTLLKEEAFDKLKSILMEPAKGQKEYRKGKNALDALNAIIKKHSSSFLQLRDALEVLLDFLNETSTDTKGYDERLYDIVFRLSECANAYYDTHRGFRWTNDEESKVPKEIAKEIIGVTDTFFKSLDKIWEQKPGSEKVADAPTQKEIKASENSIKNLDKAFRGWAEHLGTKEGNERKRIYDKLALFMPYEKDILLYKSTHKEDKWPYCVKQYDNYVRKCRLLKELEKREKRLNIDNGNFSSSMIREHAKKMDEQEDEINLSEEEVDKGLRKDQIEAVEEIDRYLVRNCRNGGILGNIRFLKFLRNNHVEIISELLRKTKRERLFIYYLIEKRERRNPSLKSVYNSQGGYTPNLAAFKKQLLATGLKITSRVTGGYIYMQKISDALDGNKKFKNVVRECGQIAREEEEDKKLSAEQKAERLNQIPEDQRPMNEAYEARKNQFKETMRNLNKLREAQLAYQNAGKGADKKKLKQEAEELQELVKTDIDKLIQADEKVDEALRGYKIANENKKLDTSPYNREADIAENAGTLVKGGASAGNNVDSIVNGTVGTVDKVLTYFAKEQIISWRLKDSPLVDTKKWGSAIGGSSLATVAAVLSAFTAANNLWNNHSKMHWGDVSATVVEILKSGLDAAVSTWGAVEKFKYYADFVGETAGNLEFVASNGLTIAGAVASGAAMAVNTYKAFSSCLDLNNSANAEEFLNDKHKERLLTDEEIAKLPKDKRDAELKRRKQVRYEKSMIELGTRLAERNATSATISLAASGCSLIAVMVPGAGVVTSIIGIGLVIANAVVNAKMTTDARKSLFDSYFDLDSLMTQIKKKMETKKRKIYDEDTFKDNLRLQLCAAAGYADLPAAADHIAGNYADFLRERLFSDDPNEFKYPKEREAYIQIVKSFGMTVDKEKDQPDRELLKRKMSGR